ncbi:MAG: 3-phosphoshikimate 1-carboxyvinyltransferase [Gemmatimonadetes bacterium]|nr:3-phosphoshikimate 1-carboxyvinyltransferase [Gemmatimonadota bacterium]
MIVRGALRVPGDKSLSHRALLFASIASGRSRLRGLLDSADVRSTAGALRACGVAVPELAGEVEVEGLGLKGWRRPTRPLDCGNSGTTTRLTAGIVAGHPISATFTGDASLSRRPMRRLQAPLEALGATVILTDGEHLPMTVKGGPLRATAWRTDVASAQVKSAVLLAGLCAGVDVSVEEPSPSRDHTERMLAALGAAIIVSGPRVSLRATARLAPLDVTIPGDPSSAAFFAALAAAAGGGEVLLRDTCLNPTRTGFFTTLQRMGAAVELLERREEGGEPVGTVRVTPGALRGRTVQGDVIPTMIDELPLLACLGALASGDTVIRDAGELRGKESDRIAAVVANLRALGADAEELPDGLRVTGSPRGEDLRNGPVATQGDHRIAMAFGVLAAATGRTLAIDDPGCVAVSYPAFWRDLAAVSA